MSIYKTYSYNEYIKSLRDFHKTKFNEHLIPYYTNFVSDIESNIEFIKNNNGSVEDLENDKNIFSVIVNRKDVRCMYSKLINNHLPNILNSSGSDGLTCNIFTKSNSYIYYMIDQQYKFTIANYVEYINFLSGWKKILFVNDYRKYFHVFDNNFISLIDAELLKFTKIHSDFILNAPDYVQDLLVFQ